MLAKEEWREKFVVNWSDYLMESLTYKSPAILGGKEMEYLSNKGTNFDINKVYVGVFFMKPGR